MAIPVVLLAGFLVWYFHKIVIYILAAAVLSIMGRPLVILLNKIHFGKRQFPQALSAAITLITLYGLIFGFFALILPMLVSQASSLSSLNTDLLMQNMSGAVSEIQDFLIRYRLIKPGEDLEALVSAKLLDVLGKTNVSDILDQAIGITGNIFVAIFSIGFITFFFLKQQRMLLNGIMLLTPLNHQTEIKHAFLKIIKLLSRYFLGLLLDVFIVMTLISLGSFIFGFKNALMIGFFAGMMNVVPYVGPIIGWILAMVFAITGSAGGGEVELMPIFLKITGLLVGVNLLDAFVMQPTIYSNVVKAHPLEIFLVILIAGSAAGIPGMILAIPTYTVIRIIAKEFMSSSRVVKQFTKNI